MKINFNYSILDISGKPMTDQDGIEVNAGKILANALVMQSEGEIIKYFDWALSLYKGEIIEIDRADQNVLENFIRNSRMIILIKKRLLEKFNSE